MWMCCTMLTVQEMFDLSHTRAAKLLESVTYAWEALGSIGETIRQLGPTLDPEKYDHPQEEVWIAKSAKIAPTVSITGPCIIGENTEVRQCAFIRGNALVGDGCVVGNSTELKNVILFDDVQVPHYNYVGDSILGCRSHMGAGSITSNVKSDKGMVIIKNGDERMETGRKKVGAMLADDVEIGCGSVLNPGTVVGKGSRVYPLTSVRGVIPAGYICKQNGELVHIHE